jgi:hypothetical protein
MSSGLSWGSSSTSLSVYSSVKKDTMGSSAKKIGWEMGRVWCVAAFEVHVVPEMTLKIINCGPSDYQRAKW